MTIRIIDEDDIHLTQAEYDLLASEYQRAMQYYGGNISFEVWVRRQQKYAEAAGFDLLKTFDSTRRGAA